MGVYETNPDQADDSCFVAAKLEHLAVGNRGRLLDARRTPVVVVASDPKRGSFVVEIEAFEDQGARWELGLEEIARFQFSRGTPTAPKAVVSELEAARKRFGQPLTVETDGAAREATAAKIAREQREASRVISAERVPSDLNLDAHISSRRGSTALMHVLERFLAGRDLLDLDRLFANTFVSNPSSGEFVKGHAMLLAELGLCPYHGNIPRDPTLLDRPWSRERRAQHVIARLAFMRALWNALDIHTVTLYRAAAAEAPLAPPAPRSFVAATFSSTVAEAHFSGGPATVAAVMWRQPVPLERILMTFLETRAMNERFLEAEAILIGDPANNAF